MKSYRTWWTSYASCSLLLIVATTWITFSVLAMEQRQLQFAAASKLQDDIRLALWRMDSATDSMLAMESTRPFFHYRSYYPHQRAYTKLLEAFGPDDLLVPSPLLEYDSPVVLLHFQKEVDGAWTSPEVPRGNLRDLAESTGIDADRIDSRDELLTLITRSFEGFPIAHTGDDGSPEGSTVEMCLAEDEVIGASPAASAQSDYGFDPSQQELDTYFGMSGGGSRSTTEDAENLGKVYQRSVQELEAREGWLAQNVIAGQAAQADLGMSIAPDVGVVEVTSFVPSWVDTGRPSLVFNRNVTVADTQLQQGFLVDFPALSEQLLQQVNDLFPQAQLQPVVPGVDLPVGAETRRLATLPVLLDVRETPEVLRAGMTPIRVALLVAWFAVIAVIVAVGLTLRSIIAYSQRRARFASAVTHELRTPLTTFQMYSELLDENLVPDEDTRREYHSTLRKESGRLARLVENVLAYSRLEDGRHDTRRETLGVADLVNRVLPSIAARVDAGSMSFDPPEVDAVSGSLDTAPDIVEQILVNLVDNACKYGADPISFRISGRGQDLHLDIVDQGSGIPAAIADRIFEPFDRGNRQGGDPTAGVGLGLALCRELARDIGGDLTIGEGPGTVFRLRLPLQRDAGDQQG
ncbi:MAG: HAMP domain-containing histidine kinase [Phycisphaerales bacterium]|nr:HAMP domain-containing histidine kinase [Phycisphaerales bacterium]